MLLMYIIVTRTNQIKPCALNELFKVFYYILYLILFLFMNLYLLNLLDCVL